MLLSEPMLFTGLSEAPMSFYTDITDICTYIPQNHIRHANIFSKIINNSPHMHLLRLKLISQSISLRREICGQNGADVYAGAAFN